MGDKATNKAMTMAFKNVLNQAFAISSAEFGDADGETPEETTGRKDRQASPSDDPPSQGEADGLPEPLQPGGELPAVGEVNMVDPGEEPTAETKKYLRDVLAALKDMAPHTNWKDVARTVTQTKFNKQDSALLTDLELRALGIHLEEKLAQGDPAVVESG